MRKYIFKRLVSSLLVLLGVVTITFFISRVIPSNPATKWAGTRATEEQLAAAREELGLDDPLPVQYVNYLKDLLHGDLGVNYSTRQPVSLELATYVPATVELVLLAFVLAIIIGIPLGIYSAKKKDRLLDHGVRFFSIGAVSLPSFWVGMILIYVFSLALNLTPVSGRGEVATITLFSTLKIQTSLLTLDGWHHIILPAITLALGNVASIIRLTRAGTQEQMRQDYVKFARSKGVGTQKVLFGHALKNTLIPVITILGLQLGDLIAFTTITETIFAWPGMGKMALDAISQNDRPIISAYLLMVSGMFIVINFIVDVLYTVIDPRVSLGKE